MRSSKFGSATARYWPAAARWAAGRQPLISPFQTLNSRHRGDPHWFPYEEYGLSCVWKRPYPAIIQAGIQISGKCDSWSKAESPAAAHFPRICADTYMRR